MEKNSKQRVLDKYQQLLEYKRKELVAKESEVDELKEEIRMLELLLNQQ